MAEILGYLIPFSLPFIAAQALSAVLAFLAVVAVDSFIAHNIEFKRTLTLSVVSLFVVPVAMAFYGINFPFIGVYAPLVTWLILGELLLDNDFTTKLKVLGVAFFVYYVLNIVLQPFVLGLI